MVEGREEPDERIAPLLRGIAVVSVTRWGHGLKGEEVFSQTEEADALDPLPGGLGDRDDG
jgi:hypothetical protein